MLLEVEQAVLNISGIALVFVSVRTRALRSVASRDDLPGLPLAIQSPIVHCHQHKGIAVM
jgi:hypothetical protein